jgi:hypothetical protein
LGNLTGSLTGLGRGGFGGGLGGFGGGFGNQFNTGQNNNTAGAQQLRVPVRIDFETGRISATDVSLKFARRLTKIPALDLKAPVAVKMDGRTAVLQGVVSSDRQRDLIARLALVEPGISSVRNELTIDSELAPAELLPGAASPSATN